MRLSWGFLVIVLLASCERRFPDYSLVDDEVYVKLCTLGEDDLEARDAHYSEWHVTLGLLREEYATYDVEFGVDRDDLSYMGNESVMKVTANRVAGDSLQLRLPYGVLKGGLLDEFSIDATPVADTVMMQVNIRLLRTLDSLEYLNWRTEQIRKREEEEQRFLEVVLEDRGLMDELEFLEGVYYKKLLETEGEQVRAGDEITLGLTGCFLNDSIFDVARDSANYIYFQYGKPDQVVRGIELALSKMREGEQVRVYCPSYLAFGTKGSKGIVPPNTPVYFDLELVRIGLHPALLAKDPAE